MGLSYLTVRRHHCHRVFFFALSLHCRPYESHKLNVVKLCSEFQIFGVLLICIVLQVNDQGLANEKIGEDSYGYILMLLTISILAIAICAIGVELAGMSGSDGETKSNTATKNVNPLRL